MKLTAATLVMLALIAWNPPSTLYLYELGLSHFPDEFSAKRNLSIFNAIRAANGLTHIKDDSLQGMIQSLFTLTAQRPMQLIRGFSGNILSTYRIDSIALVSPMKLYSFIGCLLAYIHSGIVIIVPLVIYKISVIG